MNLVNYPANTLPYCLPKARHGPAPSPCRQKISALGSGRSHQRRFPFAQASNTPSAPIAWKKTPKTGLWFCRGMPTDAPPAGLVNPPGPGIRRHRDQGASGQDPVSSGLRAVHPSRNQSTPDALWFWRASLRSRPVRQSHQARPNCARRPARKVASSVACRAASI